MTKFIFNLDCLIPSGGVLGAISSKYGVEADIDELNRAVADENIPYMECLIRYVHILGKFPVEEAQEVVAEILPHKKVGEFIKKHSDDCVVATDFPGCWTEKLLNTFDCAYYASDVLLENNTIKKLTYILKKENIVDRYKNPGDKVVFIGCDDNDMEAMRVSDISITSGVSGKPAKSILSVTNYLVYSEDALCRQLNQLL